MISPATTSRTKESLDIGELLGGMLAALDRGRLMSSIELGILGVEAVGTVLGVELGNILGMERLVGSIELGTLCTEAVGTVLGVKLGNIMGI